jgi:hypothetical protein
LAQQIRITCASLYNAFGDERALFRRALQRYLNDRVRDRIARQQQIAAACRYRRIFPGGRSSIACSVIGSGAV